METITKHIPLEDLLIQLAEEAAELAQAASKYHRAIRGINPTPVSQYGARLALIEEVADVNVAAEAVRMKLGILCDEIAVVEDEKIERWKKRIRTEAEDESQNTVDRH